MTMTEIKRLILTANGKHNIIHIFRFGIVTFSSVDDEDEDDELQRYGEEIYAICAIS